jgi:hypothetical protein
MVGRGVRVGRGVADGGPGVGVKVGVALGVQVAVAVGVGVAVGVSVGGIVALAVGGRAEAVGAAGRGVEVAGRRVAVGDGTGVTVHTGWLVSGHRPTASKKIQSSPYVI